jgi:hypothetical protein
MCLFDFIYIGRIPISEMEVEQIIEEMFRGVRINFPRRRVEVLGIDDFFQMDLADLSSLSHFNSGYKFILVGVNCFSKMVCKTT